MPKYRIGCSGFLYDSWRGPFYPEDLPHKRWLTFYMQSFDSVKLNVTFYRLLKKEAFERWYKETPPNFTFCLKGSRFVTHVKKLKDVELPLSTFFNATAPLLEKLDVVLWQLPPNLKLNLKNLEDFVENLKKHPVRHVFEFRHKSWLTKKVYNLLSEANMGLCMADWPDFIDDLPVTADFVYIRRHGDKGSYATNYTTEQLKNDAKRIKEYLKSGKDVYFYFNNDAFAFAPANAKELITILDATLPKSIKLSAEKKEKKPEKVKPKAKARAKKAARKAEAKKAALKKFVKKITTKKAAAELKKAVKKAAAKVSAKKAAASAAKKTAKKVTKKAAKKITKKITKKTAKKATKKVTKKAAKKITKKTIKKTPKKAAKKVAKKSAKKVTKKAAKKVARKKTGKTARKTTKKK